MVNVRLEPVVSKTTNQVHKGLTAHLNLPQTSGRKAVKTPMVRQNCRSEDCQKKHCPLKLGDPQKTVKNFFPLKNSSISRISRKNLQEPLCS